MLRQDRILAQLTNALSPQRITVVDESHKHEGHAGARPGGETHYRVSVVSDAFTGKSRIARHRLVMDQLGDEFASGLHALAIEAKAPDEVSAR